MKPHFVITDRDHSRRARQARARTLLFAAIVAAAWLGVLVVPGARVVVLGALGGLGLGVAVFVAAMGFAVAGIALFVVLERVGGWFVRVGRWPDADTDS